MPFFVAFSLVLQIVSYPVQQINHLYGLTIRFGLLLLVSSRSRFDLMAFGQRPHISSADGIVVRPGYKIQLQVMLYVRLPLWYIQIQTLPPFDKILPSQDDGLSFTF